MAISGSSQRNGIFRSILRTCSFRHGLEPECFGDARMPFVVFNRQDSLTRTFRTGLPAGTYCDVMSGDFLGRLLLGNHLHGRLVRPVHRHRRADHRARPVRRREGLRLRRAPEAGPRCDLTRLAGL